MNKKNKEKIKKKKKCLKKSMIGRKIEINEFYTSENLDNFIPIKFPSKILNLTKKHKNQKKTGINKITNFTEKINISISRKIKKRKKKERINSPKTKNEKLKNSKSLKNINKFLNIIRRVKSKENVFENNNFKVKKYQKNEKKKKETEKKIIKKKKKSGIIKNKKGFKNQKV